MIEQLRPDLVQGYVELIGTLEYHDSFGNRCVRFFFFNDTATTEIYTFPTRRSSDLSCHPRSGGRCKFPAERAGRSGCRPIGSDRKSTRLNSSHGSISYAVFCLK